MDQARSPATWRIDREIRLGSDAAGLKPGVAVRTLVKDEMARALPELGRLRATLFREWPYLYDPEPAFEAGYLRAIAQAEHAALVVALDGGVIVGAASVSPLAAQEDDVIQAYRRRGGDIEATVYFGESLLLEAYRGRGIGHQFFDAREFHARSIGAKTALFASVQRSETHPLRPDLPRSHEAFWRGRGYAPIAGGCWTLAWKDLGEAAEQAHDMQFWARTLLEPV